MLTEFNWLCKVAGGFSAADSLLRAQMLGSPAWTLIQTVNNPFFSMNATTSATPLSAFRFVIT